MSFILLLLLRQRTFVTTEVRIRNRVVLRGGGVRYAVRAMRNRQTLRPAGNRVVL